VRLRRIALIVVLAVANSAAVASAGDADSVAIVLTSGHNVYTPPSPNAVSTPLDRELRLLTNEARRGHVRLKVAVIATAEEIDPVSALFADPVLYTRYLGYELAGFIPFGGTLLVVMPTGIATRGPLHAKAVLALRGLAIPESATPDQLAQVAITAVRRLAADGIGVVCAHR
jgi:hypothetical protein